MLEFKVVIDKKDAGNYLSGCGIDSDISKMMVMVACDGARIVGVGAVSMQNGETVIEEIAADDFSIEYGMGKALLNSLDLGGIKNVIIKNERLADLAKKLRFQSNNSGEFHLCLDGYFTGGC